jgi:uncharacterized protein (TIGR02569 family)
VPIVPSPQVAARFGGTEPRVRLLGGRGGSWRAGSVVLKPVDRPVEMLAWERQVLADVPTTALRVAPPMLSVDGALVVDGWYAAPFLEGDHRPRSWPEIIRAGQRLHEAIRDARRPAFLSARTDPWSIADRVAWEELPLPDTAGPIERRLAIARRAVDTMHSQLIHGDLTGNVLFADGLPPAIIDLSPYWRRPDFGSAIVVADAIVWEGGGASLIAEIADSDDFGQLLIRALIYRIAADRLTDAGREVEAYTAAADFATEMAAP